MINFYQTDPAKLSDAELKALMAEIEDSVSWGSGFSDYADFEEGTWERQAYQRWGELVTEEWRRRELANPMGERGRALREYQGFIEQLTTSQLIDFFERSPVFERLAKGGRK